MGDRPPAPGAVPGRVTYRWLKADLTAALRGLPGRLLYRSPSPRTGAMWAFDDPVPGAVLAAGSRAELILGRLRAKA